MNNGDPDDRVMDGQGPLMHMGSEGWPMWSNPTDKPLELKFLKKLLLVLIASKV